jgi:flagellar FlgN protein
VTAFIEAASLLGTLEKQLHIFHELSSDLVASRSAYIKMDLDRMYQHIAMQSALCDHLRQLEADRKTAWLALCAAMAMDPETSDLPSLIARLDPKIGASMREVITKLVLAEGELRHLNRAHSLLIDGSRRTLSMLGNILASFAPTYTRPTALPSAPALGAATPGAKQ